VIVRRIAFWLIEKLHLASSSLEFFNEEDLMHILASQPRRLRDQQAIKSRGIDLVAQAIKAGAA
jgi:hypothetical protein